MLCHNGTVLCMTARKQSRSPNMILLQKPPQFPAARMRIPTVKKAQEDNETDPEDTEDPDKLDYLEHRFDATDSSGVDGPKGPC